MSSEIHGKNVYALILAFKKAIEAKVSSNQEAQLRTKVGEGKTLNTKGFSGSLR